MANSGKESSGNGAPKKPQELSMEARLGIAFALMTVVLFVTPYFVKTTAPPPAKKQAPAATPAAPAPPAQSKPVEAAPAQAVSQVAAASQDDNIIIDTNLYTIRFSNRGAVVRSWVLKKYKDHQGKPVELVNPKGGDALGYPFSLLPRGGQFASDPNQALYRATKTDDGLGVDFEYSDGKIRVKKSFHSDRDRYMNLVSCEVREGDRAVPHLLAWRGGFGDFTVANTLSTQHTLYFDNNDNKLTVNEVSAAKNGTVSVSGNYQFAGLEDNYFAAVALPAPGAGLEVQTWNDKIHFAADNKEQPHIGLALGGDGAARTNLFVGPKDIDILKSVDPRLEQVVDFGWFSFLAKPLFRALHYLHDQHIPNWGWAIIVITIIINILLLPLKISNIKSMKKMAQLQPQIKALQDKYAQYSMRDPRKQQQQQEMMDLYKKNGVNPLGGCLPMMLQLPFFIAFYKVLSVAIELRGAEWLWVSDLSQPENLALRVLPLATVASQFALQKMTPNTSADPQQQRIMQLMPLMFIFVFYSVSSGLVLYWLTGNVIGIVQQWFFNKTMHAPATQKKSGKK